MIFMDSNSSFYHQQTTPFSIRTARASISTPFDVNKDDPASVLCLAPLALERHLWGMPGEKDANNNEETHLDKWQVGLQLAKVWHHVMIHHSVSSRMPFHHSP